MHNWRTVCLNGESWKLYYGANADVAGQADDWATIAALKKAGLHSATAQVPGNFELSLYRAGLIADPYLGKNILSMQDFENRHVWYTLTFDYPHKADENTFLHFGGIDTFADIYLNGALVASTANMLIPHEVPGQGLKQGQNELVVHIKPTAIWARAFSLPTGVTAQPFNYDSLYVRKAGHMFGWDIYPRLVSGGLWREVSVVQKPAQHINDIFLYAAKIGQDGDPADMTLFFDVAVTGDSMKPYRLEIDGACGDSVFRHEHALWHTQGKAHFAIEHTKLWWPKNAGGQHLYDVTVRLFENDTLLDTYTLRTGVRTVALERTSTTDQRGKGEFVFWVNGRKIFINGTNWVGADAFHGNDLARLPQLLALLDDIGCNMVRCWGGTVYEHDSFFDFCDEKGILVWQDFAMACAIYPQDETFKALLTPEIIAVVKRLRNHPALALWAGDNECDCAYAYWSGLERNPNKNVITRQWIPELLEMHDYTRPYLPSSPYMDEAAYKEGHAYISEDHLWGPRDYYKSAYYKHSIAHFASELGYHGCPAPESLQKFLTPEGLWPWQDNDEWKTRATSPSLAPDSPYIYRIELITKQVRELFGVIPHNLHDFSMASQASQAEAVKYYIELFRSAKWRRTGLLWWNLADGWPQFSDAVVDYYGVKKLAYSFIKRAQAPVCLMFGDAENWHLPLYGANDTPDPKKIAYKVADISAGNALLFEGEAVIPGDSTVCLWQKDFSMSHKGLYLITWTGDAQGKNHYLVGNPTFDLDTYIAWLKAANIFESEGF
ncbi:MAG: glycoside hydrolase family 2 [Clostridia bacterium]|nr:glycoside hydrolase family 2 [Clostridia bacterium]